jgi:N-acyl-D-aspartate/D-glutamate deacylase
MAYDLLIKGGRIYDGSGLPAFVGDVAVKDGRIVEIGRARDGAARTIDAQGLAVSPGFIDHHTHMDAHVFWDPYATSEPQHGVTSIVMGNCGLTLAPAKPSDQDALVKSFVRVEAIPRRVLEQGVPWGWRSFGDYLNALEGKVGINVGGLVGHIAVRQYALGEESVERAATAGEVEAMKQLVREAMEGGALGFSTNRNDRHMREDGKPVASRLASEEEVFGLCTVLADLNSGIIETILGRNSIQDFEFYDRLARLTGRPIIWQSIQHRWSKPNFWREQLDAVARIFAQGFQAYGLSHTVPVERHFSLQNAQVFDAFPTWKALMFLPEEARKQAFKDPATRKKLRADLADPRPTTFHRRWDIVRVEKVLRPENHNYVGKTVEEVARMRGQDSLDAFLDLSLEEDLRTVFWNSNSGGAPAAMAEILKSPHVLIGTSDAGAHVQYGAEFGYGTTLLGLWVRERGLLTLEHAIHKLSFHIASIYGLVGRGLLRPGYIADVVVFDPGTVRACEPELTDDYPGGAKRFIQRSEGICYTIVHGRPVYEDGRLTGDLPGQVLRGSAYRLCQAAA